MSTTGLTDRILATLRYFDLQDLPLTQFELFKYLLASPERMGSAIDDQFELKGSPDLEGSRSLFEVIQAIDELVEVGKIETQNGYYFLPGRLNMVGLRLSNYGNGIVREKKVRRYLIHARNLPFIRGIALAGSQPLGQQRPGSDIDLFIITDEKFMWTGRTFLTAYFQILGKRRHGKKIANRFCLNHYLAKIRPVDAEKNLYKAMEYLKLRPVVYGQSILGFQKANQSWIQVFFPNAKFEELAQKEPQSGAQKFLEMFYIMLGGRFIERQLGSWQLQRIRQDKFIFVREDELSFHPESKHEALLSGFFKSHKQ